MPTVKCKGITALIHSDPQAPVLLDKEKRFYIIPRRLADKYVSQGSVPLLLEHNEKFVVGHVDRFYVDETLVDGEKRQVLQADFTITEEAFINAIQNASTFRLNEIAPASFQSSDGFVNVQAHKKSSYVDLDLTALEAILQRLPGLSLAHDDETMDIVEMSMCVAGARPMSLITSAIYDRSGKGKKSTEEKLKLYTTFFSALHAISNGYRSKKIEKDIKSLNMPRTCLVYSKGAKGEKAEQLTATMEPVLQHGIPHDFNESLRKVVENTFSQYMGLPQPPPPPRNPPFRYCPPDYDQEQKSHSKKRIQRFRQRDSTDEDEDEHVHKKRRPGKNNRSDHEDQSRVINDQLLEMKEQLKQLIGNRPVSPQLPPVKRAEETFVNARDLSQMLDEKFKTLHDSIQQQKMTENNQPRTLNNDDLKKEEEVKPDPSSDSQCYSLKCPTDNAQKVFADVPKTTRDHLKETIADPEFLFA